jgi:cell division protein FtsX
MKPDPDQTRWDRIDRRITTIRWLAVIILVLLLAASVLLLR